MNGDGDNDYCGDDGDYCGGNDDAYCGGDDDGDDVCIVVMMIMINLVAYSNSLQQSAPKNFVNI